jgi:hypothetical protein
MISLYEKVLKKKETRQENRTDIIVSFEHAGWCQKLG